MTIYSNSQNRMNVWETNMPGNLRDWVARRRIGGLPTERALQHPFFDLTVDEVRQMPHRQLIRELRLLPKIGDKSFHIIMAALGDL